MSHDRFDPELDSIGGRPMRRSVAGTSFPIGVFEAAGLLTGNTAHVQVMANDVLSHGLDLVMFVNNFAERDEPLLNTADERGRRKFLRRC